MNIGNDFKEKFCYEMMNLDHTNRHHYIRPDVVEKPQLIIDWIQQQVKVEPEVKVNFAEVNEVIDELIEKNLNKERWQMRPDNWREFVGYEKALKELKTILSKISA